MAYPAFSDVIHIDGNGIATVVIENKKLFRQIACDFYTSIEGDDTQLVLSKNERCLDIAKNAELLADFIHFDINKKPLLNKIVGVLEKTAVSAEHYVKTQELLAKIERAVDEWAFSFPCDIVPGKLSVSAILKSVGIELRNDYEGHRGELEKIFDYMELVREFDRDKLFITVNMRSFFENDMILEFLKTVHSHGFKVLMLESQSYKMLDLEKRITVDEDLCEF